MNLSLRAYWFGIVLISIFLVGVSYADKSTGKKSFKEEGMRWLLGMAGVM